MSGFNCNFSFNTTGNSAPLCTESTIVDMIKRGEKSLQLDLGRTDLDVFVAVPSSPCEIEGKKVLCLEVTRFEILTCKPSSRHGRIWQTIHVLRQVCSELEPPRRVLLRDFSPIWQFNQRGGYTIFEFEEQFTPCEWKDGKPISYIDKQST